VFERYTEKARRVIFFARYEASQLGSEWIEPEHLLLGLLREDRNIFAKVLGSERHFDNAAQLMGLELSGKVISTSVDLPLSHPAKRVLAYGAEESEKAGHVPIGSQHLLLGLLREPGIACDFLEKNGLELAAARTALRTGVSPLTNRQIVEGLRAQFGLMMARINPELEPSVIYKAGVEKAK
jgi:ATP-dependent Clp protease ATP-binding subunit ClpC